MYLQHSDSEIKIAVYRCGYPGEWAGASVDVAPTTLRNLLKVLVALQDAAEAQDGFVKRDNKRERATIAFQLDARWHSALGVECAGLIRGKPIITFS
ncbi:hypothetical protein CLAFUW4_13399 [Fulvia fulva]|uniref:Uncharacterized protein n=1 Tax=Passalora fulva TaxID=5499 RepID=A0A9Q8UVJ2_PASFU|nr:uncharacterized protein CLAFUR5_13252 [Fulvia fulva]KAK4612304.1 hypothetical protein CLAFUR4_13403 [Fulvia fulva]KAK4612574.1 hypothetical protein CLAFUR0_13409 [Fulvia fulva]UJO24054.1 hypothetical protein CLAFUR5_13252 [Fulvia fulva]WPV21625.1 hypothetical protein CLAFUW4_13399 [Fulvia fulva]WPV35843.1 hypothetical protein CLAFUW7_13406 [Fulvia fulva]